LTSFIRGAFEGIPKVYFVHGVTLNGALPLVALFEDDGAVLEVKHIETQESLADFE